MAVESASAVAAAKTTPPPPPRSPRTSFLAGHSTGRGTTDLRNGEMTRKPFRISTSPTSGTRFA